MSRRIALVCSAHGYGHVTRQLALGVELQALGAQLTVVCAAPLDLVAETLPGVEVLTRAVDVGISQPDSLTEDLTATRALLAERCSEARIDALADLLAGFDAAVVDVAPPALEAARRAGVPTTAMGNFDWAWIYGHYPELSDWAERFAAWQAPHQGIELWPGPGLHGFAGVTRAGLLGRVSPAHPLPPRAVLVSFGGFGLADLDAALPRLPGVTWVLAPPSPHLQRADCMRVEGVPYPALVAGAAAVFTKPGYGIFAECSLAGTPLVWVPRGAFPEAPWLARAMADCGDVALACSPNSPGFGAALGGALQSLLERPRPGQAAGSVGRELATRIYSQP